MKHNIKVLIVDDEPSILLSLEFLFKKEGYRVFIARDGQEALDIIDQEIPNVILLDIMMPRVDGYQVCSIIKNDALLQNIKVVFMSAKSKETDIKQGYDTGADLYVSKPFSNRDLVQKINVLANEI